MEEERDGGEKAMWLWRQRLGRCRSWAGPGMYSPPKASRGTLICDKVGLFVCFYCFPSFFYYSINFISFIVVQWSSQSNFIGFPTHNPSASPYSPNCLLWRLWIFQSLWVSICSAKKFIPSFFQIPHVSESIWCWCLIVWLTSLSVIISTSIHVAKNASISFLLMAQ